MKLLLGSNSPRRNELLSQMGYQFTKVSIDCDEQFDVGMPTSEVAAYLAEKKSMTYAELKADEVLITADTVVILNDKILNKPINREEAFEMLQSMSNSTHEVKTGVCIRDVHSKEVFTSTTEVEVKELSEEEISFYVDTYKPYDKAGAYGIQEWFGLVAVKGIKGCFYNVVGLPTSELFKRLNDNYDSF
ncbi:MAG: septum formation protein Maf [Bacteroidetes bacterium]|nr:MAG: septum formation protein Maf [Bacteroidota bacterium]